MKFNQSYNRESFEHLLLSITFDGKYRREYKKINIDRKTIFFDENNCFILGKVHIDKDIFVLEIKQKSKKDPRITLTKDAFKIMEDIGANYALVIFYSDDAKNYRLSLLTRKKFFGEKEESDPKRYSFLLGEGEKTKTPERQLNKQISNFQDLFAAFDVEVVRKEFFNNYLDLYVRLYREIIKDVDFTKLLKSQGVDIVSFAKTLLGKLVFLYFIQKKGWLGVSRGGEYGKNGDKDFMRSIWNDFKNNEESLSIEKKGYFYNDYLEWLFYEGLNKDRRDSEDYFANLQMKVPYLNGGLFKEDYRDWEKGISKISNEIFSNNEKNGILDIFDTYNFTVDEDDLYDKEIAVDPEMLGKIFEKMISISTENIDTILEEYNKNESLGKKKKIEIDNLLNKKLGAFYTPREIVHYMTKESLISYLVNNLKGKKDENETKMRKLFDLKEQFLVTRAEITESVFSSLSLSIVEVDELLKKVKVLDPAVGSGAFPMGLLHEISSIRYYIYGVFYETFGVNTQEYKNESGKISMYKIKRDVIQNNIYGVDISAGAIEIARLRFWLSLVVDEESPEPLPNFEFKFICANTLIPLEEEKQQGQLELDSMQKEINTETLRKYMVKYYNAQSNKDKEEWKTRIEKFLGIKEFSIRALDLYNTKSARTKQLETYEPFNPNHSAGFFDPSLMMGNSKFDIVIGNPPYIGGKGNEKIFQEVYNSSFGKRFYTRWMDIFYFFFHRGIDILKEDGILTYITTNYFITADGGINLRRDLSTRTSLSKMINFNELNIFENAKGQHNIILMLEKGYKPTKICSNCMTYEKGSQYLGRLIEDILFKKNINTQYHQILQKDIYEGNDYYIRLSGYNNENISNKILNKLLINSTELSKLANVFMGIVSLSDKISLSHIKDFREYKKGEGVYVLSKKEVDSLQLADIDLKKYIRPFFKNSDIEKYYSINNNSDSLIYIKDNGKPILLPDGLRQHFEKFKPLILKLKENFLKNEIAKSIVEKWFKNGNYFVLFTPKKEEYFLSDKIVFPYRNKKNIFSYSDSPFFASKDVGFIMIKDPDYNLKYFTAILNSKLYYYYLFNKGKRKGDVLELYSKPISNIPIKKITPKAQIPFVEKVDKILEIIKQSLYDPKDPPKEQKDLEKEIDRMVYELYELTADEIDVVENSIK